MYLWDTNILRAFTQGQPTLMQHLEQVAVSEIALPSIVVAETLQGRSEAALKAAPPNVALAHEQLRQAQRLLMRFPIVWFDNKSETVLERLRQQNRRSKRYADMMIAAIAIAGRHTLVTRNQRDFADLLPKAQLVNWIDTPPR
jgi:predicted nucleic acid-binding protein